MWNTHGPGVRCEKTPRKKGQRTPRAGCCRNKTLADRARERTSSRGADSQAACCSTGTFRGQIKKPFPSAGRPSGRNARRAHRRCAREKEEAPVKRPQEPPRSGIKFSPAFFKRRRGVGAEPQLGLRRGRNACACEKRRRGQRGRLSLHVRRARGVAAWGSSRTAREKEEAPVKRPQEPPRSGEKSFVNLFKGCGVLGQRPNSASAEAETPALAKSAGGDSASRSRRERARCGGPTRREGSPGREDLTSFLRGRSGAALDAVLPAPGVGRKAKILPPKRPSHRFQPGKQSGGLFSRQAKPARTPRGKCCRNKTLEAAREKEQAPVGRTPGPRVAVPGLFAGEKETVPPRGETVRPQCAA